MRPHRLLPIPLALVFVLAATAPASALDLDVDVVDFAFEPGQGKVAVGDTVTWSFSAPGHTTTAVGRQAERWDSGPATTPAGGTFRHTFDRPGRFQYYCDPHRDFMKGAIQVGQDAVANTIRKLTTKRRGRRISVRFTLNEPAKVTYRLKGASKRTVKRRRLRRGAHSFQVKRLNEGSHTGTLSAVDDFDKRDSAKKSFVIF